MARAINLAKHGLYLTNPNPAVGCVIVRDEKILAEGWTQKSGFAHAEVHALENAKNNGKDVKGATAYVSLEPCSFAGKTGPCTQALIDAEIRKVVYAMEDPNPKVSGQGLEQLKSAGVEIVGPVSEDAARVINPGFNKRMESGLPFIRLKMAMSVDGRTAMASGESKWITGPAARHDVQRLRARSCAVITGIETVLRDFARMSVRAEELDLPNAKEIAQRQPLRVVLDSAARLTESAPIFLEAGKIVLVNAVDTKENDLIKHFSGSDTDVDQLTLPDKHGKIHLRKLLKHLAEQECNEVLVEAGSTLAGEFIQQGLVDEIIIYMAPKLLGSSALPLFQLPLDTMAAQLPLSIQDIRAIGGDWKITAHIDRDV
ncbi:MAG: bifunctional diaminohydroxyphosphoribosylaminopyrimidine deaminase/5-amino-6-(5-phosphoribosylamino)uracil reductase RibD [Cellvibrionaceae bacterium]